MKRKNTVSAFDKTSLLWGCLINEFGEKTLTLELFCRMYLRLTLFSQKLDLETFFFLMRIK